MPASRQGHVILGVNALVLGYLPAAWLWDPRLTARSPVDAGYWRHVGAVAERGTLDALFLADGPGLGDPSYDANAARLEPTVNWAALAAATERVGLIATASTTFNDPFELAERLLSLDYASGGRAGWNIVTTRHGQAAGNFGLAGLPERGDRYERAAEFTDLVLALWESAATGREVDHRGSHFTLRGRLRVPPSPQGHPVLIQAGGSAAGRRLAGTRAEGVFSAELTKAGAIEHYREVKGYAAAAGRSPAEVKILPGVLLSLGSTEEEARRRSDQLHELGPAAYSVQWLSGSLGIDASALSLDEPFPEDVLRQALDPAFAGGSIGFRQSIVGQIRQTRPTVREYLRQTRYTGSGHHGFTGTPEQFADHVEDWYRSGAIDGFNLQPDVLADGLEVIADEVVPLLRRRGLFRHEYETTTLRGHFAAASGRKAETV
jgi:FMN-dependent oxidoreductase (nitrilotriacetate monooxygenase family)